ncbi:hypothetical protein I6F07_31745 [Ensifer sp. IC4062]|nr:hypothetical protein [Ensifer sp. IC4062]MCA1444665.1 hypothetical protein [Ensifer sp. IC4062]
MERLSSQQRKAKALEIFGPFVHAHNCVARLRNAGFRNSDDAEIEKAHIALPEFQKCKALPL